MEFGDGARGCWEGKCVHKEELWAARDPPTFQGKWRSWDSKEYRRNCLVKDDKYHEFPRWLRDKESACNARAAKDTVSIPESGRSPGGGNGKPFWYSCPENPMDREAWWATVHGVTKSQTWLKWLSSLRNMWTSWKRICLLYVLSPAKLIWARHCCGSKDMSKNSLILPLPRSRAEFPSPVCELHVTSNLLDLAKWWAMISRSAYKKMAASILGERSCSLSLSLSRITWSEVGVLRGDWRTEDLRAPVDSSSQLASHLSEPAWNWILCSQANLQITVASSNVFMRKPELEPSNRAALRNYEISICCFKSLSIFY